MHPFIRTRRSFEYEKEVRAVTSTLFRPLTPAHAADQEDGQLAPRSEAVPVPPSPRRLTVPVDVERLIVRVRVSPVSSRWFTELVDSVIRRYGFKFAVAQSDIDGDPVY